MDQRALYVNLQTTVSPQNHLPQEIPCQYATLTAGVLAVVTKHFGTA